MSRRREVVSLIVENLKLIDGTQSPLDNNYDFEIDLHGNVYRGFSFIDEINDFPSIFVVAGDEERIYETVGTTESNLEILIRCYIYDYEEELVNEQVTLLQRDIEHIIYNLPRTHTNLEIKDTIIERINTDEGLLSPYGIVEVLVRVTFESNI